MTKPHSPALGPFRFYMVSHAAAEHATGEGFPFLRRHQLLHLEAQSKGFGHNALPSMEKRSRCQCHDAYRIILSDMTQHPDQSSVILALREEFRSHLETFYSRLKLAPPYESVEKAIRSLTTAVHSLPVAQQARLPQKPELKWEQFRRAFETSGLAKKHRGIIAGLAQNRHALGLPSEYDHFLDLFTSSPTTTS